MSDGTVSPVIVALDFPDAAMAMALAKRLDPSQCRVKVGLELFSAAGPAVVEALQEHGFDVFLDLKLHDIPNTVAAACRRAAALGVWMVTVHASGGQRMLASARDALADGERPPLLVGVTVLTSLAASDLADIGIAKVLSEQVHGLAGLALASGCDGLVCSPRDAASLRNRFGQGPRLVTPGIRADDAAIVADDQRRTLAAPEAMAAGSNYLVIGRPITRAADPARALERIVRLLGY